MNTIFTSLFRMPRWARWTNEDQRKLDEQMAKLNAEDLARTTKKLAECLDEYSKALMSFESCLNERQMEKYMELKLKASNANFQSIHFNSLTSKQPSGRYWEKRR